MSEESVRRIQKRFYLTLINPGSHITSLLISFASASLIVLLSYHYYLEIPLSELAVTLPLSLAVLFGAKMIDFVMLKNLPITKLTKVYHTAAFTNIFWLITIVLGIVAASLLSKPTVHFHFIVAGMFFAIGLRIVVFTSVFGASIPRAILTSSILPLIFFIAFMPIESVPFYLADPVGFGFGLSFMAMATIWFAIADRAGRPGVESTFKLLQAYLQAWTDMNPRPIEKMLESRACEPTWARLWPTGVSRESGSSAPGTAGASI